MRRNKGDDVGGGINTTDGDSSKRIGPSANIRQIDRIESGLDRSHLQHSTGGITWRIGRAINDLNVVDIECTRIDRAIEHNLEATDLRCPIGGAWIKRIAGGLTYGAHAAADDARTA